METATRVLRGSTRSQTIEQRYRPAASHLDGFVFLLVAAQVAVEWTMPHGAPQGMVDWHLTLGAIVTLAAVARLIWRLRHPASSTTSMAVWEDVPDRITHGLSYALLLAIPVAGWSAAWYLGHAIHLFGAIPLPQLADPAMEWGHAARAIHDVLADMLLGVVGVYGFVALWRYFFGVTHRLTRRV